MTTHTRTYPTERAARRAVQTPRATGPTPTSVRSRAPHHTDTRREPAGGYAGPLAPDAPTGTYGDRALQRHHGTGSLAGDPDHQRHGTYADTDRVTIITHNGNAERTRITGPPGTRRPLHRTAPDDDTIDRAARALHHEHTTLLANPHPTATSQTHARLEKLAHAARARAAPRAHPSICAPGVRRHATAPTPRREADQHDMAQLPPRQQDSAPRRTSLLLRTRT
jgi:hypothetical protein